MIWKIIAVVATIGGFAAIIFLPWLLCKGLKEINDAMRPRKD